MKDKNKNKGQYKKIIAFVLIFIATIIITLISYKTKFFGEVSIDELSFYISNGLTGANTGTFFSSILKNIIPFVIILCILSIPIINLYKNKVLIDINIKIKGKNHNIQINPTKIEQKYLIIYALIVFFISLACGLNSLNTYSYVISKSTSSNLFEQNYVNPKDAKVTFPEKKRNLIYIYLESTENAILSSKNGGGLKDSLSPELENIALNNISFSNTSLLGGALPAYGTTWTVGGMVAQSAGVPLISPGSYGDNDFNKFKKFLPGAYSLGEILEKEGYNQEIVLGSDASFGGRDKYFTQHGNYKIFDYKTAVEQSKIPKDYHVWWGYEDNKLIEYTKQELLKMSKTSQPFNLQLLTADTHFVDGYIDPTCAKDHDNQYENVFACASKRISTFIDWAKQQDFYDNTTIIIHGDHLGMQTDFYDARLSDGYQRTIYNAIINSKKEATSEKGRQFSSFDMYPTTLSSIGVEIEGNKLGLGVNLFSNEQTLVEKYGLEYLNTELSKKSNYYNNHILIGK